MIIIHCLICLLLIGLVLIQQGEGADAGAGMTNSSQSLFGATGSANFLSRTTAIIATLFFISCIVLYRIDYHQQHQTLEKMVQSTQPILPKTTNPS